MWKEDLPLPLPISDFQAAKTRRPLVLWRYLFCRCRHDSVFEKWDRIPDGRKKGKISRKKTLNNNKSLNLAAWSEVLFPFVFNIHLAWYRQKNGVPSMRHVSCPPFHCFLFFSSWFVLCCPFEILLISACVPAMRQVLSAGSPDQNRYSSLLLQIFGIGGAKNGK